MRSSEHSAGGEQTMTDAYTLPLCDERATIEQVGGKGASLALMARAGFPIPDGFHVTVPAYRCFIAVNRLDEKIEAGLQGLRDDAESLASASIDIRKAFHSALIPDLIAQQITTAYRALPGDSPSVAVRSSATAEDLPEASFAGQHETRLNVVGVEALLEAARECWSSLWTDRAIEYRRRMAPGPEQVGLALVVQLLVPADAAGVVFTANPMNGRRDQLVVSGSWGLGEAVVQGEVTPDMLTVDRMSGRVVNREVATKGMRTVPVAGGTQEQPVPNSLCDAPVLTDDQAGALSALAIRVADWYRMPMDIEWALAEDEFAILQARPITALPDPDIPAPSEWRLPAGVYSAMRNNIVELMANPLTPLFKTLGVAAVNRSLVRTLAGFLGSRDVLPHDPIIVVNEYAYYNGSVRLGPMLKIMLNASAILRRMLTGAVERWTDDGLPRYRRAIETWKAKSWQDLPNRELLSAVRHLTEAAVDAYGTLVSGVLPAAWMSEAWFTLIHRLIGGRSGPPAAPYLMGFESLPTRADKSLFDAAQWAMTDRTLTDYLLRAPSGEVAESLADDLGAPGVPSEVWNEWSTRFRLHLDEFGHMIYSLDFSNPVLSDDPSPALDTLKLFVAGGGTDPHARQAEAASRREAATEEMAGGLRGWRLRLFRRSLARAQRYAPLREDGLADIGLAYPLLRQMLLTLGVRLVDGGMIEVEKDIFWLTEDEIQAAADQLDDEGVVERWTGEMITHRKAVWMAAREVSPPVMLPRIRIDKGSPMWLTRLLGRKKAAATLKGVGASSGTVTGPALVVHGPEDFGRFTIGEILVAPLTTPAWTPLFARAAGIVTDVGGPLSHGSIVAREYGIPAVLGTGEATSRIAAGQTITVNGDKGVVTLEANGMR